MKDKQIDGELKVADSPPLKCQNCNKHKATENWVGDGGIMAFIHGFYQQWCKCCALKEQVKHAREAVKNLEKLETKLKNIKCK